MYRHEFHVVLSFCIRLFFRSFFLFFSLLLSSASLSRCVCCLSFIFYQVAARGRWARPSTKKLRIVRDHTNTTSTKREREREQQQQSREGPERRQTNTQRWTRLVVVVDVHAIESATMSTPLVSTPMSTTARPTTTTIHDYDNSQ